MSEIKTQRYYDHVSKEIKEIKVKVIKKNPIQLGKGGALKGAIPTPVKEGKTLNKSKE